MAAMANNDNSRGIDRTSSSVSSRSDSSEGLARASSFAVSGTQSLASILNNPHVGKAGVYGSDASWLSGWWSSASSASFAGPAELPPLMIKQAIPDVQRSDFETYLGVISETYGRFEDIRLHSSREEESSNGELSAAAASASSSQVVGQGEALVACLREVPSLYFKEDFALEEGATFRAACPFSSAAENALLQEKLSQYLDTVEMHLVKEISLRSNSFFEAQGQLQGLNFQIVEACGRIRELKETIRLLQGDVVDSARKIQDLNGTRSSFIALQQKLTLILYVSQALSALKLLVEAADCAGALDVTDDLRHLLDSKQLFGLHCFLHLREHLATSINSVNNILSSDFMHASILEADNVELIILRLKAKVTNLTNVGTDVGETASFVDRLFPIIIGLLRTAKLPYVLRIYREKLIDDMKAAIKTMVSELLPILVARPAESDLALREQTADTDGAGSSMATKMRNLSSESFLRLLDVVFEIVQAYLVRASEVKHAIEQIMHDLDGTYTADSVATALALGAAAAETGQENEKTSPSNMERNFRADILRENTEALLAACDAAQGRWAKLLGVRALLHPKLRLPEFLSIHNISQDFITATEKIGGRHAYSIRGTLQSQMKAFIDFQHESRMEKLKALLDQETWVAVDVPYEFQAIVNSLVSSENGNLVDASSNGAASYSEVVSVNGDLAVVDTQVSPQPPVGNTNSSDNSVSSTSLSKGAQESKIEAPTSSARTLVYKGNSYHLVNCCLILLKMLSEYIAMNKFLPSLASEVVHRVVEILKYFNQRTVFLVLGAGAMQVSGMRAITAKHLALSSQVISFVYDIIPELRHVLLLRVPESRKALLLSDINRDYKGHRDEIHTKLVQIMTERLVVHLRSLPQIVESWNRPEDNDLQPSQFARALVKEVGILQRVLSRTLHEVDVKAIFRQVAQIFHSQISEKFRELEINTTQAKNRLYQDLQHILGCIHSLPTDDVDEDGVPNKGKLDEFLLQKFGTETPKGNNCIGELKSAREAVKFAATGSAIGALSLGGISWKYSKSPHGALLALGAGAVFGWTFGQEVAGHWLQLYRLDTVTAQDKFLDWWIEKTEGGSMAQKKDLLEEYREFRRLRTAVIMEKCMVKNEPVMCPKPRKRCVRSSVAHADPNVPPELSDILMSKASPTYYSGSPPVRCNNPLIQDTRFREQSVQQNPSFGIWIEGYDPVGDHPRRGQSIPTIA
ncbi:hypothetical protein Syun_024789 [Stephania yunnanensis]|uniref:Vacuolar protein sorting-associated protein 54 C-terminal domain-containing protein n=1 Tax=Stephania yunnanensis TaxID=152371 RepID=A0AAP0EQW1_9MAGN